MMLFFLAALLVALTLAMLFLPLLRDNPPADPTASVASQHNLQVYRDQLQELDRDEKAGLFSEEERLAAQREIERRLIKEQKNINAAESKSSQSKSQLLLALLIGLVPLFAGALYLSQGQPAMKAFPIATRDDLTTAPAMDGGAHAELSDMISKLRERLAENPEDLEGWALLARSLVNISEYDKALEAYGQAITLTEGRDAQIAAEYAETLVLAADGIVIPEAENIFQNLFSADENDPQALFYLGLANAQRGAYEQAESQWQKIIATSPSDAPWLGAVRAQLAELKRQSGTTPTGSVSGSGPESGSVSGPSAADIAAAQSMTPAQQAQMIDQMVASLAAKMEQNPDDLAGWQKLAGAYQVLERKDELIYALENVVRLDPDNQDAKEKLRLLKQE